MMKDEAARTHWRPGNRKTRMKDIGILRLCENAALGLERLTKHPKKEANWRLRKVKYWFSWWDFHQTRSNLNRDEQSLFGFRGQTFTKHDRTWTGRNSHLNCRSALLLACAWMQRRSLTSWNTPFYQNHSRSETWNDSFPSNQTPGNWIPNSISFPQKWRGLSVSSAGSPIEVTTKGRFEKIHVLGSTRKKLADERKANH